MAYFGVKVIKLEMSGEGDSFCLLGPYHDSEGIICFAMRRNKKSTTLELKYGEGKKVFLI